MTASSTDPGMGESDKSNEIIVNTHSENFQKPEKKTPKKENIPKLNVSITSMYDDALGVEWYQPLFGMLYCNVGILLKSFFCYQ